MFKIVSAKLDVLNGEMVATLTLSGRGYDYLYAGTSAQADAADKRTCPPSRPMQKASTPTPCLFPSWMPR